MATRPDQIFHSTDTKGLYFRELVNGTRTYWGYVPQRGRVKLAATTPRNAQAEYRALRSDVEKGAVKLAPASLKLQDVCVQWLEVKNGRLALGTRRDYEAALTNEIYPALGTRKIRDLDVDDIAKWIRKLEARGLSTSTIENYSKPLRGALAFAVRRGYVASNPMDALTVDDRPVKRVRDKAREWTPQEIQDLFWAARAWHKEAAGSTADYEPLLRVAVFSGLRLGEILGLQWQDVDLEHGAINVARQWTRHEQYTGTKTKAGHRRVPVRPELVALLKGMKESAFSRGLAKPEDLVFPNRNGDPKRHRVVQRAYDSIATKAGLEGTSFHDLRHAYASIAISAGADVVFLSRVLGHARPSVTLDIYSHAYDRATKEEAFVAAQVEKVKW
jgi:integrase